MKTLYRECREIAKNLSKNLSSNQKKIFEITKSFLA